MNERYRRLIPSYMLRHKIKPGITGWAQIHGHRGGDDLEGMRKRIEFDLQYLSNWSLQLDLLIIARTVATVLANRHAY
jgi:putative colanic acid biosynthesis UDP-glucose lipid carrier transferase